LAQVVWTDQANRWLKKIHDYIARDKPGAAFDVVQAIYARAQILAQFPELGHKHKSASGREVRILLWGHYRIVYHVVANRDVHVLGVFHGAMELNQYLE
jgi:plasmid stabilization system protein ParE